jgi:hypothetical protein
MNKVLLVLMLAGLAGSACAQQSFADANALAKADSTAPATRDWYLQSMRPAFRQVFEPALSSCAGQAVQQDVQKGFALVFTVTSEGRVKQVLWDAETTWTACLDKTLRDASFPPAPKPEFFFGVEIRPSGTRA